MPQVNMISSFLSYKRLPLAQVNDDGFWLFSRKPVDPEAAAAAREKAKALGLDVSQLRKVQQEGCAYAGAV